MAALEQGAALWSWELGGTSTQYSARIEGTQSARDPTTPPGQFGMRLSDHVEHAYTWNSSVW